MGLVQTLKTDAEERGLVCYTNQYDNDSRALLITCRNHGLKIGDPETEEITERLQPFVQRYGRRHPDRSGNIKEPRIEHMIIEATETADWDFEKLARYGDFKLQGVIPFLKDELCIKAIGDKEELDEQKKLEEKLSDLIKEILKGKDGINRGYNCREFNETHKRLEKVYNNREKDLYEETEKAYNSTTEGIIWLDTGAFHVPRITKQSKIPCIGIITPELEKNINNDEEYKQSCLEVIKKYTILLE